MSAKANAVLIGVGLVVLVTLVGGLMAFETVPEGTVGVEKERGAVTGNILEPDWHLINPVSQSVVEIDTRPQIQSWSGDSSLSMITGDGQDVTMEMTVRYRVEANNADRFHSEYRSHDQAVDRVIHPTVKSNARNEASNIPVQEIITQSGRTTLEDSIEESLNENVEGTGITIEAVQVQRVQPNDEYSKALENIEIENTKAEQKQIRAEADRNAYQTRTEGLSEEVLMEKYIESIDESDKVVLATGDDGTPVMLDASGDQGSASGATTSSDELAENAEQDSNESSGNESGGN